MANIFVSMLKHPNSGSLSSSSTFREEFFDSFHLTKNSWTQRVVTFLKSISVQSVFVGVAQFKGNTKVSK